MERKIEENDKKNKKVNFHSFFTQDYEVLKIIVFQFFLFLYPCSKQCPGLETIHPKGVSQIS